MSLKKVIPIENKGSKSEWEGMVRVRYFPPNKHSQKSTFMNFKLVKSQLDNGFRLLSNVSTKRPKTIPENYWYSLTNETKKKVIKSYLDHSNRFNKLFLRNNKGWNC